MTTVRDITSRIEQFAPKNLAEEWDPIGLSFGSFDNKVNKVLVALDFDKNTLKEAKEKDVDLIFTHHPAIFSALKTLNSHDSRRSEYLELIRSDIALYSAHTNIDSAENGMNDWLAKAIDLKEPYDILETGYQSELKLLALYTPLEDAERMRDVLHSVGAGQVGDYSNVSYTATGMGRFKPESNASPTIGEEGKTEEVKEERVEMLFPSHLLGRILEAIYKNHPYEEPVYHILDIGKKDKDYGLGRLGEFEDAITLEEAIIKVKKAFNLEKVRSANIELDHKIKKVAILGGSGEKYYKQALSKQADLYVTGDISYHGAQDMIRDGLPFIDAGHFIENIFTEKMTEILNQWNKEEEWNVEFIPATSQEDVFKFN